jgi:hypothetical protein
MKMKPRPKPDLMVLDGEFAVHRFNAGAAIPATILNTPFVTISRTDDELSIVCPSHIELGSEQCESGWVCMRAVGPLDFGLTGVLAALSAVLAETRISIYAISTFDTDYILVKKADTDRSVEALKAAGYRFR